MREIFRPAACALSVACLALAISAVSSGEVLAQAKQAPPKQSAPAQAAPPPAAEAPAIKQIALTDKQIEGVLAATRTSTPSPTSPRQRQTGSEGRRAARRRRQEERFASYDEYNTVVDNISLVFGGFDPATKKFVGAETVLKAQVAGSKPPSTRLILSRTPRCCIRRSWRKPFFLATASSCASTFGSGLALSGILSVTASTSLLAVSTPSICLSVRAICLMAGGERPTGEPARTASAAPAWPAPAPRRWIRLKSRARDRRISGRRRLGEKLSPHGRLLVLGQGFEFLGYNG